MLGPRVELLEVVRCIQRFARRESEPGEIVDDRPGEFDVFGIGVGVVVTQIADTTELRSDAEIDADGLGMADV